MNVEKIKEILERIPISLIIVLYVLYLFFDYYSFENDATSPKLLKKKELAASVEANAKLTVKLKEMNEFVKTLEAKKVEVRGLAQDLKNIKGSLSEGGNDTAFFEQMHTEASRARVKLVSLVPVNAEAVPKEYYSERAFKVSFRSVFVQLYTFLNQIANISQIVRVESFFIKAVENKGPDKSSENKFVMLEGELVLKTYKYLGTTADAIADSPSLPSRESTAATSKTPIKPGAKKK